MLTPNARITGNAIPMRILLKHKTIKANPQSDAVDAAKVPFTSGMIDAATVEMPIPRSVAGLARKLNGECGGNNSRQIARSSVNG